MYSGVINKFNRGEVDETLFTREDVVTLQNSAAHINNFLPVRAGPMYFRQGTEYLDSVAGASNLVDFVAGIDDYAILEFTDQLLRVWVEDELVSRTSVTSTITNGYFTSDITSWTDTSGSGSTATWLTGGYLALKGSDTTSASVYQTLGTTQTGAEHGLRIVNSRGRIALKIGTSGADSDDIFSGTLGPGTHSLVFTPTSDVTLTLINSKNYTVLVDSVALETTGVMTLPTSVEEADLGLIRYKQSADVVFITNSDAPFRVERRGVKSWSVVEYRSDDGPFESINISDITLTPGALSGDTTLAASAALFESGHVGSLFKVGSSGQQVTASVSTDNAGTGNIRVTGVDTSRAFTISVTGTFVATITLQRSADESVWEDVENYTGTTGKGYNDAFDNSIFYYRLMVKSGGYTSGTAALSLTYSSGSIEGVARVVSITSSTVAAVQVLEPFGSTSASLDWYEGSWSPKRGYPSAVGIYEGRLWLAGKNSIWGSVSDAYTSYDRSIEGNSASIFRTVGYGPVDTVSWLAESTRLIMGLTSDEVAVRSSSFGEILTATNANLKAGSNRGAAAVNPVKIDDRVYFTQRSGVKIFSLAYNINNDAHNAGDLTTTHPRICIEGIKKIVYTREPETRIWVLMNDGTLRVYLFDLTEKVSGWVRMGTGGTSFDDIVVIPGDLEDRVYVVIDGMLAKFALSSEVSTKYFDLFETYTSPGTTITGLSHLEGETVSVHADGENRGTFTVSSGSITVPTAWTDVVVGLPYEADFISNKLARYSPKSVLTRRKRVVDTAVVMKDYLPGSLEIGPSSLLLRPLPEVDTSVDTLVSSYDELPFEFDGDTETDPRIYMKATGPCTILALTYGVWKSGQPDDKTEQAG